MITNPPERLTVANPPERLTELNTKHKTLKDNEEGYLENGDSDCD